MVVLTPETAKTAKIIRNIQHPEWGDKRFNYNEQPLSVGVCSTYGREGAGPNTVLLFESEYHLWEVIK